MEDDALDPVMEDRARSLLTLAAETVPATDLEVSPPHPRRPARTWLAAAAAVAVVAVGVPLALAGSDDDRPPAPAGPQVVVPQTLWMTEDQAVDTLSDAGLEPDRMWADTCSVEMGRIVSTTPGPTQQVAPGTKVLVQVARPPDAARCAWGNEDALGLLDLARFGVSRLDFAATVELYVEGRPTRTLTAHEAQDPAAWGDPSPLTDLLDWVATVPTSMKTPLVSPSGDRGDQYACGASDPPAALRGRPSTVLSVGVPVLVDGQFGCNWLRVYRDDAGRIDAVTSASSPSAGPS